MAIKRERVGYRGDGALVDRIEHENRFVGSGVGQFVQVGAQVARLDRWRSLVESSLARASVNGHEHAGTPSEVALES
jgi:hypothetical protein